MSKNIAAAIEEELLNLGNQHDVAFLQRFFKTGPGEYGEGDLFLGIRVPNVRTIAKKYKNQVTLADIQELLNSKWHEVRLCAVVLMNYSYPKQSPEVQGATYDLYKENIGKGINNWDLVDVSCPHIMGAYLYDKQRTDLYELAKGGLWQKRVSIISTFYFLRNGDITDSLQLAELLVQEQHDLLQKAVGWTLREIGKIDDSILRTFLDKHAATMPRTMLRYSLEKLSTANKNHYMALKNKH